MSDIVIFDSTNLDQLSSTLHPPEALYAKAFLIPLIERGIQPYIHNVNVEVKALKVDENIFPLIINHNQYEQSWVCSPYGHFISYAIDSLDFVMENKMFKGIAKHSLTFLGWILKKLNINQVVYVNNWLCATDLYPAWNEQTVQRITQFLQSRYPQHAIIFRSINPAINPDYFKEIQENCFDLIVSKLIYFSDTKKDEIFNRRIFKSDLKCVKETDYEVIDASQIKQEDFKRILELYEQVYVQRYSSLSPQLSTQYLELMFHQGLLKLIALRKNGRIDGAAGYFCRNGIMLSSFFGYDTTLPQDLHLYRILSTLLMLEARKEGVVYHQSSGASFYRKIRKMQSSIDYMAVCTTHLSKKRRFSWQIIKLLMNKIGYSAIVNY